MHILLSNDDGLFAEGLQTLRRELKLAMPEARITVVAPHRERSAMSHALTLGEPMRIEDHGDGQYAVTGTPTDCVLYAVQGMLKDDPPDVLVSGINHGPNMGEDVHYSGTVGAAFEGHIVHVPSLALSLATKAPERDFRGAIHFIHHVLPRWLHDELVHPCLLNINIPSAPPEEIAGIRACPLGSRRYVDSIVQREDPRGRAYFWMGGDSVTFDDIEGTDFVMSAENYITVTPLQVDATAYDQLDRYTKVEGDWS